MRAWKQEKYDATLQLYCVYENMQNLKNKYSLLKMLYATFYLVK